MDRLLEKYSLERVDAPHCYEMYGGQTFHELMDEEPGTFFLTDFLVRGFRGTILKGMGLDKYPQLKDEYFRNYKRIVYLEQKHDPELVAKAQKAAAYLELPLEIRHTGYGLLEERLVEMMNHKPQTKVTRLFDEAIQNCNHVNISSGNLMFGLELAAADLIRLSGASLRPIRKGKRG